MPGYDDETLTQAPDVQAATGRPAAPAPDPLEAVAGLIQAIQSMSQAPLFPTAEGRFGAGMMGLGAALQGRQNPAVDWAMKQRKMDLEALEQHMRSRLTMETLRQKILDQQAQKHQQRREMLWKIVEPGLKSEDAGSRMFFAGQLPGLFQELGIQMPPEAVASIAKLPFDKKRLEQALLLLSDPDIPPDTVTKTTGLDPGALGALNQLLRRAPTDPQAAATLKAFGVDVLEATGRFTEMKVKQLTALHQTYGLTNDEGKALLQLSVKEYGKTFDQLTVAQRKVLFDTFGPTLPGQPKTSEILSARQQFREDSKVFRDVRDAFGRIQESAQNAAGDISLIVGYNKLIDPGSTVREGEFDRSTVGNLAEKAKAYAEKYFGQGGMLTDQQRTQIRQQSAKLFRSHVRSHERLEKEHARGAADLKMRPDQVIFDFIGPFRGTASPPSPLPGAREVEVRRLMKFGLDEGEIVTAMRKAGWP